VAVLDGDGIAFELDVGIEIVDAGAAVKGPAMPRADDLVSVKIAVAEWTAGVRAETVEATECALVIANGVGGAVDLDLGEGAGREISEGFDFGEGHLQEIA
jgi:hypothetical protein